MTKDTLISVVLIFVSVLTALFASEFIYRSYLVLSYDKKSAVLGNQFAFYSKPLTIFDQQNGYSYNSDTDLYTLYISDGKAISCAPFIYINHFGTFEKDISDYTAAEKDYEKRGPRILVFGDSFTSIPHDGETWVSLFSKKFKEKIDPNAQVLNFGRDGYGVVQMLELAANKIETWKPDLILFAFITDDLRRIRFWRKNVDTKDGGFSYVAYNLLDDENSIDSKVLFFYNKQITKERCEAINSGKDDPLITSSFEFAKRISKAELNKNSPSFFVRESYLYNLITQGTPIVHNSERSVKSVDQLRDANFKTAVEKLNQSKIPYFFIHIPAIEEMRKNARWLPSRDNEYFIEELSQTTGKKHFLFLSDFMKLTKEQLALFPITPKDGHPSKNGIQFISDAMIDLYLGKDNDKNDELSNIIARKSGLFTKQINFSPLFESAADWGSNFAEAKNQGGGNGVVVGPGEINVLGQQFPAKAGDKFKIVAKASSPNTIRNFFGLIKKKTMGRIQINWIGSGKFIDSYLEPFDVDSEERTFATNVIAPSGSEFGVLYVVANGPEDIVRYTEMSVLGDANSGETLNSTASRKTN